MANKNAPFGARVVGKLGSAPQTGGTTEYSIASGASGNIFSGDLVKMTNTGTILVSAAGDESIGVFRGCTFTNSSGDTVFSSHYPDGTVSSDIVAFVIDDPDAVYFLHCRIYQNWYVSSRIIWNNSSHNCYVQNYGLFE